MAFTDALYTRAAGAPKVTKRATDDYDRLYAAVDRMLTTRRQAEWAERDLRDLFLRLPTPKS